MDRLRNIRGVPKSIRNNSNQLKLKANNYIKLANGWRISNPRPIISDIRVICVCVSGVQFIIYCMCFWTWDVCWFRLFHKLFFFWSIINQIAESSISSVSVFCVCVKCFRVNAVDMKLQISTRMWGEISSLFRYIFINTVWDIGAVQRT